MDFFCAVCGFRKGYDPADDPKNQSANKKSSNIKQNNPSSSSSNVNRVNYVYHI